MQSETTLYKINHHNALEDSIVIETTNSVRDNPPHVLFCSGFYSSMRGLKAEYLYQLCKQRQWGFTRFDYRGHGESDAEAEHCTISDWLEDTLAVIDQLPDKVVLVGSSMGAWIAVNALLQRPAKVQGLLTIAAAPDFTQLLLWPALSEEEQAALLNNECITRETHYDRAHWRIRHGLIEAGKNLTLLDNDKANEVRTPVRMLHGTADADVPWTFSQRLLEKFIHSPDATLTLINGADHRLSEPVQLSMLETQLDQLIALS